MDLLIFEWTNTHLKDQYYGLKSSLMNVLGPQGDWISLSLSLPMNLLLPPFISSVLWDQQHQPRAPDLVSASKTPNFAVMATIPTGTNDLKWTINETGSEGADRPIGGFNWHFWPRWVKPCHVDLQPQLTCDKSVLCSQNEFMRTHGERRRTYLKVSVCSAVSSLRL